jgi:hypothetical protein
MNLLISLLLSYMTIEQKIVFYANQYDVDPVTSLRIAECESQFGKYKYNWEGSGATGLYQFKPSTFNYFCDGDIMNDEDQIKCFMELYPRYSHYWECQ